MPLGVVRFRRLTRNRDKRAHEVADPVRLRLQLVPYEAVAANHDGGVVDDRAHVGGPPREDVAVHRRLCDGVDVELLPGRELFLGLGLGVGGRAVDAALQNETLQRWLRGARFARPGGEAGAGNEMMNELMWKGQEVDGVLLSAWQLVEQGVMSAQEFLEQQRQVVQSRLAHSLDVGVARPPPAVHL